MKIMRSKSVGTKQSQGGVAAREVRIRHRDAQPKGGDNGRRGLYAQENIGFIRQRRGQL
jgi:hypothetical protein